MKRDKGLLNEILPDPEQAARDLRSGSPRDRTTAHLKRILAAAAAAALPFSSALGDNSVPGDKRDGGAKSGQTKSEPQKPPEPNIGYGVVDPMPQPYVNRTAGEGTARITSKPAGASVTVDGVDTGQKTPIKKLKLAAGQHAIGATSADGKITKNLIVDIKPGASVSESFDLRPAKTPKK